VSEENIFQSTNEDIEQDILKVLIDLCNKHGELQKEIEDLSLSLKEKSEELQYISRISIPSILNSNSLSEIRLSNGAKLTVKDKIKSSIINKNVMLARRNMIEAEGGENAKELIDSLFKSELIIENYTDEQLDLLLENDIPYESKKSIHHQTLNKYCKERLEQGKKIPEGISVFQYQETTIKKS
jgi:hypothetical protein